MEAETLEDQGVFPAFLEGLQFTFHRVGWKVLQMFREQKELAPVFGRVGITHAGLLGLLAHDFEKLYAGLGEGAIDFFLGNRQQLRDFARCKADVVVVVDDFGDLRTFRGEAFEGFVKAANDL